MIFLCFFKGHKYEPAKGFYKKCSSCEAVKEDTAKIKEFVNKNYDFGPRGVVSVKNSKNEE